MWPQKSYNHWLCFVLWGKQRSEVWGRKAIWYNNEWGQSLFWVLSTTWLSNVLFYNYHHGHYITYYLVIIKETLGISGLNKLVFFSYFYQVTRRDGYDNSYRRSIFLHSSVSVILTGSPRDPKKTTMAPVKITLSHRKRGLSLLYGNKFSHEYPLWIFIYILLFRIMSCDPLRKGNVRPGPWDLTILASTAGRWERQNILGDGNWLANH